MKKILSTIGKCLLFFLGWAVIVGLIPIPNELNPPLWRFVAEIIPLLGIMLFTAFFYFVEKKEISILTISNFGKGTTYGFTSGIVWLGLTTLLFYIFGIIKVETTNQVDMLALWIFSALLNVVMQELLVRGYLYQLIKKKYNLIAAVIVTTALFTLLHGGAIEAGIIPTLNVITMSLFMSILLEYTQSLIAPIIAHAFWNIVGALILGSVSLADDYPNLFDTQFVGNEIISGGNLKFEGSIIVLIINVFFIIFFLHLHKKNSHVK
ncbi:MAG: CAAX protease [Epulopiscium sp. Nele67-Bin005]|nr:MAG: CAAX protease [Epulopiscium sp. Nele67-Bin005]